MCVSKTFHYPVLYREILEHCPQTARYILDCTFGHAGHAKYLLQNLAEIEKYIGLDQDPDVIADFQAQDFKRYSNIELIHTNFADISRYQNYIDHKLDLILMDLGTSMHQLRNAERGFSFLKDGPLDMRMNTSEGILLKDWIDTASQTEISDTLKTYGEEKFHHRISIAIKENSSHLKSTLDLANCIEKCLPKSYVRQQKIHVATRSFQAFRIMLNRELESLEDALSNLFPYLRPGGRIMVISFHSLEDRIVKNIFREWERSDHPIPGIPGDYKSSLGRCSPRKVIRPTVLEVEENSASRSARMRIFEKALNA